MKKLLAVLFAATAALLSGCAGLSHETAHQTGTCYVCKYNNDLACVCVDVKADTPRVEHDGVTYYFCSDDCRAAFLKRPEKYLPRAAGK